jgi:hypothetical protein
MAGMIDPRRLIITTLSFLLGCKGDLDHSPAQRGRHSNGARKGQQVARLLQRIDQLCSLEALHGRSHFRL